MLLTCAGSIAAEAGLLPLGLLDGTDQFSIRYPVQPEILQSGSLIDLIDIHASSLFRHSAKQHFILKTAV